MSLLSLLGKQENLEPKLDLLVAMLKRCAREGQTKGLSGSCTLVLGSGDNCAWTLDFGQGLLQEQRTDSPNCLIRFTDQALGLFLDGRGDIGQAVSNGDIACFGNLNLLDALAQIMAAAVQSSTDTVACTEGLANG